MKDVLHVDLCVSVDRFFPCPVIVHYGEYLSALQDHPCSTNENLCCVRLTEPSYVAQWCGSV